MLSYNEYNIKRTAFASFTIPSGTASTILQSGAVIPKGAIVTGVRYVAPAAVTITGASATVQLQVGTTTGSVALCATVNESALAASVTPTPMALATTNGILISTNGLLSLNCGSSSNSAVTATYDFYVDYLFTGSHD